MKRSRLRKFTFEFLSIFIAVLSAFALNKWNEHRIDRNAETKILREISNGLTHDLEDAKLNAKGHNKGLRSCLFWKNLILQKDQELDSIKTFYHFLNRDFISVQNTSGYESLKSRGLETIENDELRSSIIALYEIDFNILKKLEEDYHEMQFHESYFNTMNETLAPFFVFDTLGTLVSIQTPLALNNSEKNIVLSILNKIEDSRKFTLRFYSGLEEKINEIENAIQKEID